ncbi:MAG: hypothetical protein JWP92_3672 [Caulobacter sp.]|nr:hypothetical protein [Caulobacter sp.]
MGLALSSSAASSASAYPETAALRGRLEAARQAVEGKFLEAGDVLSQAVQGVGELIAALDRLTAGLDPETVRATTAELTSAAASLRALPDSHAERRGRIDGLVQASDGLSGRIDDMRQHLAYLRVFAINIKITSGGIVAAGPEFAVFAQEIYDCIELGRTRLDALAGDLMALDGALRSALVHEQDLSRHCGELVPAVPDGLTASASAVATHHESIASVAASVADLARRVQKKVGGALAALQIGDITRQRIEHVQTGLDLLDRPEGGERLDADQRQRLETFVRGLLAAQLAATARDFHREVSRIGDNMAGMASDASEILRLKDLAYGRSDSGDGGFLRGLENTVGQALGLVGKMDAGDQIAENVGHSAAAAARELTERIAGIQTIRADVQMMALNTTLKCSRIGDTGKPLGVIAIELRQHASHLETAAGHTLTALDGLSAKANALGRRDAEGETAAGDRESSQAANVLNGAIARIRKAGDAVEIDLVAVAQQGSAVVDSLRRAAGRLDFQREIGAILDQVADDLATMAGTETVRTNDIGSTLGPLLAKLAKAYTMAQEREVHQALVGALALTTAPAAVVQSDPDDVLF